MDFHADAKTARKMLGRAAPSGGGQAYLCSSVGLLARPEERPKLKMMIFLVRMPPFFSGPACSAWRFMLKGEAHKILNFAGKTESGINYLLLLVYK
jgi:hypothetical protein